MRKRATKEQQYHERLGRQLRQMQVQIDANIAHHVRKHAEDYGVPITESYVRAVSFHASGVLTDHLDAYLVACRRSRLRHMDHLVELNHLTNQFGGVQQLSIFEGGAGVPPQPLKGA